MISFNETLKTLCDTVGGTTSVEGALFKKYINSSIKELENEFDFWFLETESDLTQTIQTTAGKTSYRLPFDLKKIISVTFNSVSGIPYIPIIGGNQVTGNWDDLDPKYYMFNHEIEVFPTPINNQDLIKIRYIKRADKDYTIDDYTSGSIAFTKGSNILTGTGTNWTNRMNKRYIRITENNTNGGDHEWYEIDEILSPISIKLKNNYAGETGSAAQYVISQLSKIPTQYWSIIEAKAMYKYHMMKENIEMAREYKSEYRDLKNTMRSNYENKDTSPAIQGTAIFSSGLPNVY